jgi:hypothetical protein
VTNKLDADIQDLVDLANAVLDELIAVAWLTRKNFKELEADEYREMTHERWVKLLETSARYKERYEAMKVELALAGSANSPRPVSVSCYFAVVNSKYSELSKRKIRSENYFGVVLKILVDTGVAVTNAKFILDRFPRDPEVLSGLGHKVLTEAAMLQHYRNANSMREVPRRGDVPGYDLLVKRSELVEDTYLPVDTRDPRPLSGACGAPTGKHVAQWRSDVCPVDDSPEAFEQWLRWELYGLDSWEAPGSMAETFDECPDARQHLFPDVVRDAYLLARILTDGHGFPEFDGPEPSRDEDCNLVEVRNHLRAILAWFKASIPKALAPATDGNRQPADAAGPQAMLARVHDLLMSATGLDLDRRQALPTHAQPAPANPEVTAAEAQPQATQAVPAAPAQDATGDDDGDQDVPSENEQAIPAAVNSRAYLSPSGMAELFHVPENALRKRLERWRRSNVAGTGWMENTERKPKEPQYLYMVASVWSIINELKKATSETTSKRPAKKT